MLPITVYNQKGGQAKSTLTRDLAAAYAEIGLDVLIVDFDAQDISVSNYLGVDDDKRDADADDITLHLIDQGKGPFEDLIRSVEGEENIDVIPSHKRFGDVDDHLDRHANYLEASKPDGWEYPRYKRFQQVIKENEVHKDYDVMFVDPNAKADEAYYLALYATQNVVIPAVPTRAGFDSISGVKNSASNFADAMDISISMLAAVPTRAELGKNLHSEYTEKMHETFNSPVYFKSLGVYEKAEENYVTVFNQLKSASRMRDYQKQILPKYRTLAAKVYANAGRTLPEGVWSREDLYLGDDDWEVDESDLPLGADKQEKAMEVA